MRFKAFGLAVVGASLMAGHGAPLAAQGASSQAWLHVRVEEPRKQGKVSVNLPISVVEALLEAAPERIVSEGRIHLGHHKDLSVSELKRAWNELKATGDAELVTVEEEDEKVRIARSGNLVLVHVEKPLGRDSVRVEIPVDVVDALFSGQGNELNLRAAFSRLQSRRGDIVRVNDEDSTVRIWIDEKN